MVKEKELVKAAKELNKLMGCDPPIDETPGNIAEQIIEAGDIIDWEIDVFSEETLAVLRELGVGPPDEREDDKEDLVRLVKNTGKLADLKKIAKAHDVFKKLRKRLVGYKSLKGLSSLRTDMYNILTGELPPPKPAPPVPKVQKAPHTVARAQRREYLAQLLEEGRFTRQEIIDRVLDKYPGPSQDSISTILSDSKNPKYNTLARLAVEEKGVFKFEEGRHVALAQGRGLKQV